MHQSRASDGCQTQSRITDDAQRSGFVETTTSCTSQSLGVSARQQLHREVEPITGRSGVMARDDLRMLELAECVNFSDETSGIRTTTKWNDLERDLTTDGYLYRAPHATGSTPAN